MRKAFVGFTSARVAEVIGDPESIAAVEAGADLWLETRAGGKVLAAVDQDGCLVAVRDVVPGELEKLEEEALEVRES